MTITLTAELEKALTEAARRRGTTPEALALDSLRAAFAPAEEAPLSETQFEALADQLAEEFGKAGGDQAAPLPEHALTRAGIYGDHP